MGACALSKQKLQNVVRRKAKTVNDVSKRGDGTSACAVSSHGLLTLLQSQNNDVSQAILARVEDCDLFQVPNYSVHLFGGLP